MALNNINVNENIYITQKSNNINLFIYTNVTQESHIDVSVNNVQVNSFALFGFSINTQIIIDSNINISIEFQVLVGALLCIQCDVEVQSCNLVFIASGQQISGLIIEPKQSVVVQQSFIQYRICSMNSSGLINVIKQLQVVLIINQCKLTGGNLVQSTNNGYIASTILQNIILNITQFEICVDQTSRFGQKSVQITIIGSESVKCDMCNEQSVVYGLCGDVLLYSESNNGMYQCIYPFEYIDNKCICAHGYLINMTKCINIVESINNINNFANSNISDQITLIQQKVENQLIIIDQDILSNISEIENRILSNYSKSDYNLLMNTTILDSRIFSNITNVQKDIIIIQMKADDNLLQNTTVLDWRIFNNISQLNTSIQNISHQLKDVNNSFLLKNQIFEQQLQLQNQIIEQQKILVDNLTQQLNCTSNYGYSMINGQCIQVTCAISGQQSINGICQCTNINSIVQSGSCVCPPNSNVIGTACVCSIIGQTMQNGQCACSTNGAFVNNNVCLCGVNGINISNTCSCPNGASLVNGVCTCSNINAYISGDKCVCPTYSQLIGNTCTCPSNSKIINNECVCNQVAGQIMNNGVCKCQTLGAFETNEACICGQYALNTSNICTCPTNSTLVNSICTCDQIIGQQMISGSCQCPSGYAIVNNQCQQTSYAINTTNFECSQEIFTSSFDINSITNQVNTSSNFSSGYIFSASITIQNAFIDISDNIYTLTVYPLFQSQSTFINLKIQFGTQSLNSGILIISQSIQISVNQMNIISRPGCQLTINTALLNILTSSSTSANITNLLVNLSFASSSGNITLINNINSVLNISGYQVLGQFISTGTVAMIGINVNAATINVNQVSFKPISYNVGNASSYLFGNVISTTCTFMINSIAIILGSSQNFQLLGSLSSGQLYYYQFGGIIANFNSNSIINIINVVLDSFHKFSTNYVRHSGFLVGYAQSSQSSVIIKSVCLQQNITSTTQQFQSFGLIGWNNGNSSIQNASITFSVQCSQLSYFGIVGFQYVSSFYAEVINLRTSVNVFSNSDSVHIGSVFGVPEGKNISIQNTTVVGGSINSGALVGGFCSYQNSQTNMTILYSTISKTNISGSNRVGGFVGFCQPQTLYLINSKIEFVRISGSSSFGIVIGLNQGTQSFINSSSSSNYVNGVLQNDCAVLSNSWSVSAC
ncbi:Conserved_hypothetical protein [Hexamita inflata]|uniref:Uncharacterized protein n=1 Tax=Hexamita inflata TaxID=28002 RepID=A0AA86U165_9EUKA|nr:Conserved hypothetical protein [Hexamita inflata]